MKKRTFLGIIAFTLVCVFVLSAVTLVSNETAKPSNKSAPETCNSTLLSVMVGALIGLVSSIGTGTIVFILQSRHERKVFMRSKSEELITLVYQCDDWLDQLLLGYLVQGDINTIFDKFPVNKMKMLQVQYFQNLKKEADILIAAVKESRKSIILERENLSKTHQYSDEFRKSYERNQATVSKAIQDLAEKARTKEV
jgi:ABC-type transport system involved in multi-copper enzyme maturation permease subunit